jgi:hypothetical protein
MYLKTTTGGQDSKKYIAEGDAIRERVFFNRDHNRTKKIKDLKRKRKKGKNT